MIETKTIFIVPGFRQRPTQKAYKELAKLLKSEGYSPILVRIPWKESTISENTEYFLKKYNKINTKNKYILGFSFGAMIAFLASTKVNVKGLILCSLSPYFKEDLPKINKKLVSSLRLTRYKDFQQLQFSTLVKQVKAKSILMVYGQEESKPLIKRVTQAYDLLESKEKYLIRIKETEHDISDKRYLHTLHYLAKELN